MGGRASGRPERAACAGEMAWAAGGGRSERVSGACFRHMNSDPCMGPYSVATSDQTSRPVLEPCIQHSAYFPFDYHERLLDYHALR